MKSFWPIVKFFLPGCQNCILLVRKKLFEKEISSEEKSIFFIIIGHWSKNSRLLVQKFSAECRNCFLRVHKNIFERDWCFKKLLYLFRTLSEKYSAFCEKIVPRGCQNCILRNQMNNLEKDGFSEKNLYFSSFADCEQKLFGFWSKFFLGVVKTAFYLSERTFTGKKVLLKKVCFFHHFQTVSRKCSASGRKVCRGVVKTALHVSTRAFFGEIVLLKSF